MMRKYLILCIIFTSIDLFAQEQQLSPSAMRSDLAILHDSWTSLHPGLYRYNSPEQVEGYFNKLRRRCDKPLGEKIFYLQLSQLAQKVKCGHTYLNPRNLDSLTASRILPDKVIPLFFEVIHQQQIIITQTLGNQSGVHPGDEIIAINGIPVRSIMDSLLTVSRSDGNHSTGKKYNNINETPEEANGYSLFDIYFPIFFKSTEHIDISVRSYVTDQLSVHRFSLMTLKDRLAAYEHFYGTVPTDEKSWAYYQLNNRTAYMKFGTFAFWNSSFNEKKYVDSIFDDLNRHPRITNIVIDIRGNEGGDNTGDYILSYITNKRLGCNDPDHPCYRFLTVPDSLLPYLPTWDNSFKAPKKTSDFFTNALGLHEKTNKTKDCAYIEPQVKRFKGKVYVLINAKNSSAGYEMARNIKLNHLGLLIGETTGGCQQGINGGEFLFLTLPNSHFEIDLPLIFNYHPNKPDEGINPDFYAPTTQRDLARHADPQLKFAKYLISKSK